MKNTRAKGALKKAEIALNEAVDKIVGNEELNVNGEAGRAADTMRKEVGALTSSASNWRQEALMRGH
ncbi:hypothetical protein [Variovorax sp. LG9.2]|uniref:hypothetical protein n=1 Tax=Variovorax sp. LG9.2 TaxID=3048626 RepID=UPI002B23B35F|nr:hypothetical protein [Variovorax sp. LG9.2]MEB0059661.1 hypothetical protein [Variovorax sp. LG9.2]